MEDFLKLNIFGESEENDGYEDDDFLNQPINFDEDTSEFANDKSKPTAHDTPANSKQPMKADNIELTEKDFNKAKEQAQKSAAAAKTLMENAASIMEMLSRATINNDASSFQEDTLSAQEELVEAYALQAFEDGAFFEAADDKNKDSNKKIARKLRNDIFNTGKKSKMDMVKVQVLARGEVAAEDEIWKIVGIIISNKKTAEGFIKTASSKLADKLTNAILTLEGASQAQLAAINKKRKNNPATEAYLIKVEYEKK